MKPVPRCLCTVPGAGPCSVHRDLPPQERPQPPLFDAACRLFGQLLDAGLEDQVDAWADEGEDE